MNARSTITSRRTPALSLRTTLTPAGHDLALMIAAGFAPG